MGAARRLAPFLRFGILIKVPDSTRGGIFMGLMIEGKWDNDATIPSDSRGRFIREASRFRHWITPDGSPGPAGEGGFEAEPDRYHLFVSPSCPWAHRTSILRKLKKLDGVISMSVADRPKTEGWAYSHAVDDLQPCADGVFRLYQVYAAADSKYTGKVTVPTLWDRKRRRIVNNESSEICAPKSIKSINSSTSTSTMVSTARALPSLKKRMPMRQKKFLRA
jgi:glutathionyl-hydroquinone reductase